MNRTQIGLAAELYNLMISNPPAYAPKDKEFIWDLNQPKRQRRRLGFAAFQWLQQLGKRELGEDHPAVKSLTRG